MRETGTGFGVLRGLLVVVAVGVLLVVAFYAALIALGVAVVYFTVRAIVRAVSGRGHTSYSGETIVIAPAKRSTTPDPSASTPRIYVLPPRATEG